MSHFRFINKLIFNFDYNSILKANSKIPKIQLKPFFFEKIRTPDISIFNDHELLFFLFYLEIRNIEFDFFIVKILRKKPIQKL